MSRQLLSLEAAIARKCKINVFEKVSLEKLQVIRVVHLGGLFVFLRTSFSRPASSGSLSRIPQTDAPSRLRRSEAVFFEGTFSIPHGYA